ncbi:basic proline-rich protein-like [Pteronotus mesoamericanus]|uniref:basic proline-rich protein-like n=1 Tax=Pteronotus mesoamericanus TaxID=1884717 RepID=UPI0023EBF17E|nr:basic proline-rich protein-like [Pteronotus parnellii mesoamericanus]
MRSLMVPQRRQVCRGQPGAPPPGWASGLSGELSARPHPAAGQGEGAALLAFPSPCPARGSVTLSPRPWRHGAVIGRHSAPSPGPAGILGYPRFGAPACPSPWPPTSPIQVPIWQQRASSSPGGPQGQQRPQGLRRPPHPLACRSPFPPPVSIAQMVCDSVRQCPLLPRPPTRPPLARGPLATGFAGPTPPPAGSPLPTIAPPSGRPADAPRGQEPPPQGTRLRLRVLMPAVQWEPTVEGSGHSPAAGSRGPPGLWEAVAPGGEGEGCLEGPRGGVGGTPTPSSPPFPAGPRTARAPPVSRPWEQQAEARGARRWGPRDPTLPCAQLAQAAPDRSAKIRQPLALGSLLSSDHRPPAAAGGQKSCAEGTPCHRRPLARKHGLCGPGEPGPACRWPREAKKIKRTQPARTPASSSASYCQEQMGSQAELEDPLHEALPERSAPLLTLCTSWRGVEGGGQGAGPTPSGASAGPWARPRPEARPEALLQAQAQSPRSDPPCPPRPALAHTPAPDFWPPDSSSPISLSAHTRPVSKSDTGRLGPLRPLTALHPPSLPALDGAHGRTRACVTARDPPASGAGARSPGVSS